MDTYPPKEDTARIQRYQTYESIFLGDHFDAFNMMSKDVSKDYAALKYVTSNFGGLISKLAADMLFEEFPKFSLEKGDQTFMDAFINTIKVQIYESGLEQSYSGDVLFRIRSEDKKCIVEDINPAYYFPEYDDNNVRAEPQAHVLAWKVPIAGNQKSAVFLEKHYKGKIVNELWQLDEAGALAVQLPIGEYLRDDLGNPIPDEVDTKVDEFLIVHIPNYRIRTQYYGISDYKDLTSLMFAINNRMTKIDSILDKHGEPILAVPQGVLDDDGKVKRGSFGVIEVDSTSAGGEMPTYIVWDAKLEAAEAEIDRLVDFLFMFSETSQAIFGKDAGAGAESGRALKYKLLRTIAKKHRKELYYDAKLKELCLTVQKFSQANTLEIAGVKCTKDPEPVVIKWQDGVINDSQEILDQETTKVDAGLTTKAEAIANIDGISIREAEAKVAKINKEREADKPKFNANPLIPPNGKTMPPNNDVQ